MFDGNIWVLIPLAAILIGGFSEYLKFKAKQQKLGDSTKETEKELSRLNKQLEAKNTDLVRRIENLEAIVTSQTWDHIHGLPGRETNSVPAARERGHDDPEHGDRNRDNRGRERSRGVKSDDARSLLGDDLDRDAAYGDSDLSDDRRAEQLARRLRNE